nr:hypothetical protein [Treponema sp.]
MKKIQRRFAFCFLLISSFFCPLFAADGLMFGEKDLRVVKTQWFDIIYPARCEKTASLLYQTADTIYEEVTAQYGIQPSVRYPVSITPATQQLNAFFTVAHYNRIVMFDTSSSEIDELSGSFSQGFLSVFRHELTHAVTYNMKNKFWTAIGNVFGDIANLGYLFLSSGMAEGASVTSESAAGEGRLNNEFFNHRVKQAKIENKFPSYYDMQGSSDSYPSGAFYDFNAAFHLWLQKKYGMEKYYTFWYKLINMQSFGVSSAFKKAYGIKLKEAWKLFKADYSVPDIPANPVEAGLVFDFFQPDSASYSSRNNYGARYSSLTLSEKGLAWIEHSSGSVYFLACENYQQPSRVKKLFTHKGLDHVKFSSDGKYLAVSYYSAAAANIKADVKIYDMESRRFFDCGIKGLKDAALVKAEDSYYLVGQRYESPYNFIESYQLIIDEASGRIKGFEKSAGKEESLYVFSGSFTGCQSSEGRPCFAYLQNNSLNFSIILSDFEGNELASYALPEGYYASQLSYSEERGEFLFNWASSGTMVRAGRLSLQSGSFDFSSLDLSGGIFYPTFFGEELLYVGKFFRQNRLFTLPLEKAFAVEKSEVAESAISAEFASSALFEMELDPELKLDFRKYNPFAYLLRGVILPISYYTSEAFGVNTGKNGAAYALPYGLTYYTNTPWTSGSEGILQFTAGWGPDTNSFGTGFTLNGGATTGLFFYQTAAGSEFDKKGWKQAYGDLVLSSSLPFGRISNITLENSLSGKIGRQNQVSQTSPISDTINLDEVINYYIGMYAPSDDTLYYRFSETFTTVYSNIVSAGPGRHEYAGFALGAGISYIKDQSIKENPVTYQDSLAVTAIAKAYLPALLPFESDYGYTTNLPLKLALGFFPSTSNYGYAASSEKSFGIPILDATVETVLFGVNVQKALPFFTPLFIHEFYVTAGYTGTFSSYNASKTGFQPLYLADYFAGLKDGTALYQDSIFLKFALD